MSLKHDVINQISTIVTLIDCQITSVKEIRSFLKTSLKQDKEIKNKRKKKKETWRNGWRSGSTASHYSPDRHTRTGSSPAIVTGSAFSSPDLGNSHGSGTTSLTHSSNRSLRNTQSPSESYQQHQHQQRSEQQQPLEEEVLVEKKRNPLKMQCSTS
ncbi:hypothetical protein M0802_009631 [Mischocyttarus mexicanus]|nr:hypothetical protein M0802_009631 [Mischocyttarus mexicanus]